MCMPSSSQLCNESQCSVFCLPYSFDLNHFFKVPLWLYWLLKLWMWIFQLFNKTSASEFIEVNISVIYQHMHFHDSDLCMACKQPNKIFSKCLVIFVLFLAIWAVSVLNSHKNNVTIKIKNSVWKIEFLFVFTYSFFFYLKVQYDPEMFSRGFPYLNSFCIYI